MHKKQTLKITAFFLLQIFLSTGISQAKDIVEVNYLSPFLHIGNFQFKNLLKKPNIQQLNKLKTAQKAIPLRVSIEEIKRLLAHNEVRKARILVTELLLKNAQNVAVRSLRARILFKEGEFEKARIEAERCLALDPNAEYMNMLIQEIAAKKFDANNLLNEAVLDPYFSHDPARAFYSLACDYGRKGDLEKAEACLVNSITLSDGLERAPFLQMGFLYSDRGESEIKLLEENLPPQQKLKILSNAAQYFYNSINYFDDAVMVARVNTSDAEEYEVEYVDKPRAYYKGQFLSTIATFKQIYSEHYEQDLDLDFETGGMEIEKQNGKIVKTKQAIMRELESEFDIKIDETEKEFTREELQILYFHLKFNAEHLPHHFRLIKVLKRIQGNKFGGLMGITVPQGIILATDSFFEVSPFKQREAVTHEILDGYSRNQGYLKAHEFVERLNDDNNKPKKEEIDHLLIMNWLKAGEWWYSNQAIEKIMQRLEYNVRRRLSMHDVVEKNVSLLMGIVYAHLPYELNLFDMISSVGFDPVEDFAEFGKYYLNEGPRLRRKVFFELQNGRLTFAYRYIVLMENIFNQKQFGQEEKNQVTVSQISEREFEFSNGEEKIIVYLPENIHISFPRAEVANEIVTGDSLKPKAVTELGLANNQINPSI